VRTTTLGLVAVILALAGCGGNGGSTTAPPATTTTAAPPIAPPTKVGPATTAAPPRTTTAPQRTTTRPHTVVTTPERQQPTVIEIRIVGGKPAGGIKHVTVEKPDLVDLVVHSDVADEVHLHGYDLHQDVEAGGTARIRFQAKIQGVFEAELEDRKLQILELTVK
jgi:hypothetical protein